MTSKHHKDPDSEEEGAATQGPSGRTAVAAGGGGLGLLVLLNELLRSSGTDSMEQVLREAGPLLGPLYQNAPIVCAIVGLALWLRSEYRSKKKEDRRSAQLVRQSIDDLREGQGLTTAAVDGLRTDMNERSRVVDARLDAERLATAERLAAHEKLADLRFGEQGAKIDRVTLRIDEIDRAQRRITKPISRPSAAAAPVTSRRKS
jgi:hypothetical protein